MTTTENALETEKRDLLAELANTRAQLLTTVRGLSDERLGERPTQSELCLGGLVKHVTNMERSWMRFVLEGPSAMSFELPEGVTWADIEAGTAREYPKWMTDRIAEFQVLPGDTREAILARYEEVAQRTEEVITELPDLLTSHPVPEAPWHEPGTELTVRQVLLHVISETAQHAGHADIIRETLDGQTTT
ncbi:DinB family protein [Saccharopolyspora rhizosphaerae]|uniref:DinB family protein n=1 Tax=Saccharopolyspora rhizosphaerae TaxID=2492662 RepID=A0A3R8QP51_9PSEU|nr:DinB family protein [Saccharopolyspora rhizosphaerae]RRO16708.1 DinB family protein [Saccharopolyspora rhizosphaerae]